MERVDAIIKLSVQVHCWLQSICFLEIELICSNILTILWRTANLTSARIRYDVAGKQRKCLCILAIKIYGKNSIIILEKGKLFKFCVKVFFQSENNVPYSLGVHINFYLDVCECGMFYIWQSHLQGGGWHIIQQ